MGKPQLSEVVSLHDVENKALKILPLAVRGYYQSGADDEETLQANRKAFSNFVIRPFALRDVSKLETSVHLSLCCSTVDNVQREWKRTFRYPIGIAPTAFQRMAHEEGEIATVKAASETGTPMICSTLSTVPLEEVARNAGPNATIWFQLYVYKDRSVTERLIRRVEKAGFTALVLTVDAPLFGRRRADERNAFALPGHLRIANFEDAASLMSSFQGDVGASGLSRYVISLFDASLNWADLQWLIRFTKLPVIVKGIVRSDDALRAIAAGAAAIVVSNHGGRQLDHCIATIDALPGIVKAVQGKVPVFVDGGFRTGTDVFKALALGADLVFIGRPIVYGLALGGQKGVEHVVNLLRTELEYAMKLSGCASIDQIRSAKDIVVRKTDFCSKL